MSVQLWKHGIDWTHCESPRQLVVSWQQLPTMHWLHDVPPGSSEQLPASMGMPQWPLSHARPMQHAEDDVQLDPTARQAPVPQVPFMHFIEQQSPAVAHAKPSSAHAMFPQMPPLQRPLQQLLGPVQASPS
jgi:hypothetical protein